MNSHEVYMMLRSKADPAKREGMMQYMRNQFDFIGVSSPDRVEVVKAFYAKHKQVDEDGFKQFFFSCWENPYREMQYVGLDVGKLYQRKLDYHIVPFFETFIVEKSWWDTVDCLVPHLIGKRLIKNPKLVEYYAEKWIDSDNLWLNRGAIILQLHFAENTNAILLESLILKHAQSREFFIQKASGWALRQYSKTDKRFVADLLKRHGSKLSLLTKREASKYL